MKVRLKAQELEAYRFSTLIHDMRFFDHMFYDEQGRKLLPRNGDVIIINPDGTLTLCDSDEFDKTYEILQTEGGC